VSPIDLLSFHEGAGQCFDLLLHAEARHPRT
jgi:hypothetical protein